MGPSLLDVEESFPSPVIAGVVGVDGDRKLSVGLGEVTTFG